MISLAMLLGLEKPKPLPKKHKSSVPTEIYALAAHGGTPESREQRRTLRLQYEAEYLRNRKMTAEELADDFGLGVGTANADLRLLMAKGVAKHDNRVPFLWEAL